MCPCHLFLGKKAGGGAGGRRGIVLIVVAAHETQHETAVATESDQAFRGMYTQYIYILSRVVGLP